MCSFLFSTWVLKNLWFVNYFMQKRGPDYTNHVEKFGYTFVHNLLHMTGERVAQPFSYQNDKIFILFNGEIYNYQEIEDRYNMKFPTDDTSDGGIDSDVASFPVSAGTESDRNKFVRGMDKRDILPKSATESQQSNQKQFSFSTDGHSIYPAYIELGDQFVKLLDGEYAIAIVDTRLDRVTLAMDVFGTKPLWYSVTDGIHVATYESALERMGVKNRIQLEPNTVLTINLNSGLVTGRSTNFEFDLRQYKTTTADWIATFKRAVKKRIRYQRHGVFLGLSSGYDSGAINLALHQLKKLHFGYTIYGGENVDIVGQRLQFSESSAEGNVVLFSEELLNKEYNFLLNATEPFSYKAANGQPVMVSSDFASSGLSWICRETRKRGILIYLSGSGADEYISDYGFGGEKIYPHSNFGGNFPEQLEVIFPWHSFFTGTQRDYLMKEELIAGTHGVEGRYPFLDKEVVQEYLWIKDDVKNSKYKVVLDDWFKADGYPYVGGKTGFNPHWNLIEAHKDAQQQPGIPYQINHKENMRDDEWFKRGGSQEKQQSGNQHQDVTTSTSSNEMVLNSMDAEAESGGFHGGRVSQGEKPKTEGAGGIKLDHNGDLSGSLAEWPMHLKLSLEEVNFVSRPDFDLSTTNNLVREKACQMKTLINLDKRSCCVGKSEIERAFRRVLKDQGVQISDEEITSHIGGGMQGTYNPSLSADKGELLPQGSAASTPQMTSDGLVVPNSYCYPDKLQQEAADLNAGALDLEEGFKKLEEGRIWLEKQRKVLEEYQQRLNDAQVIQRAGSLHLVMMRLAKLEAVADQSVPEARHLAEKKDLFLDTDNIQKGGVVVLTCVSGGTKLMVTDFPVYRIFENTATSQGLPVINMCDNVEWGGMKGRLERYSDYLHDWWNLNDPATDEALFLVSDGMDVFFNDMSPVYEMEGVQNTKELVRKRYRRFNKKVVISSERICGWGGAHLCTEADAGRYPDSPTTSKFVNAGGYIGPAKALWEMITAVLADVSACKNHPHTRECGSGQGNPDQYFFMKYFWENQDKVGLDNNHLIFGNMLEVEQKACWDGWVPRCAMTPCCSTSDRIESFSYIANGVYDTRGCSVFRQKETLQAGWSLPDEPYKMNRYYPPSGPEIMLEPTDAQRYVYEKEPLLWKIERDLIAGRNNSFYDNNEPTLEKLKKGLWEKAHEKSDSYGNVKKTGGKPTELSDMVPPTRDNWPGKMQYFIDGSMLSLDSKPAYKKPWNLPLTWHGNGCGKWIYLISLDSLSRTCPVVAQSVAVETRKQILDDREVLNRVERLQNRRWNDER